MKTKTYKHTIGDAMALAESKKPTGWKAFRWQQADGGHIVTGAIPIGTYRSGPRKGRPKYPKDSQIVVVTTEELNAKAKEYEKETGNCWECKGTGLVFVGWSKAEGSKRNTCPRCSGVGKLGTT
jgi:hypothetical protein